MKRFKKIRNILEIAICSCFVTAIFFFISLSFYCKEYFSSENSFLFLLIQTVVGIVGVLFPKWLRRKKQITISPYLYCFYLLFLFASLFLGEICHFYIFFPGWDLLLHFLSGMLIFYISYEWLEKNFSVKINKRRYLLAIAFFISLAIGSLWEIYEFINDGLLGTNMQRFFNQKGIAFIGRSAIMDTMSDMIFDCFGASFGAMLVLKKQKNEKN